MREGCPSVASAIDAFLSDLELGGRSPRTLGPYRSYLKPLLARDNLADVTDADLRQMILARLRTNARTAYALHAVLSSFFAWCERQGYGPTPMHAIPRPKKKPPEHRYLSQQEIRRVYDACTSDDQRLVVRLLLLGLRARELLGLTAADIDFDRQEAHIRMTKGGRPRRVWFDDATAALLAGRQGRIVACSYDSLRERLQRLSVRSGVPFTAHAWRRTWASQMFLAGANQAAVQRLGGWSGSKMAEFYARSALDEASLRDAARVGLTSRLLDE